MIVAFFIGGVNLLFPVRSARFRRRKDPELEARIEAAGADGRIEELGQEIGFFRRWMYRDYFYPRGNRLMALPYFAIGIFILFV